jgi:DNA replication and repair protein RecF
MRLTHLSLTNFRAFSRLDLDIPGGIVVLVGDNAQGKTSLLEAVYFLAAFTSFQTSQDNQVVSFSARNDEIPVSRIVAEYEKGGKRTTLELRLILQTTVSSTGAPAQRLRKEILLNGVKKPATQAIREFNAVVFIPQMTRFIDNGPEERRRYLNMTLCQVVPGYAEDLTRYQQALTRRNALLKLIAEKGGDVSQLDFWDKLLAGFGGRMMAVRSQAVGEIDSMAAPIHAGLTSQSERFQMIYRPTFNPLDGKDVTNNNKFEGNWQDVSLADLEQVFLHRLHTSRRVDVARGVTTSGPHRDDLLFSVNGQNLADFGSRGQIRTALQSLKLGEMQWMREKTGEMPVVLLDETLAELDEHRRFGLLQTVSSCEQVLLTTTDLDLFSPEFLKVSHLWRIASGSVKVNDPTLPSP